MNEEETTGMDAARATPSASLRRDGIVEAVAFAAERLLLSSDWRRSADEVLERLGTAADASRAYIVENRVHPDGRLSATWIAEWTRPGVVRVMDDEEYRETSWEASGFGRWVTLLERGDEVCAVLADLPAEERRALERHGVVSLVTLPVFVDGVWWGAMGFDDCLEAREWSAEELAALRAATAVLGAAIMRQRADQQLRESEERYRNLVDHSPDAILVHADGHFVYANPAAADLLAADGPSSLVGLPIEAIVHPDFRHAVVDRVNGEQLGRVAPLLEEKFIRLDGWEISVEVAGIPMTYEGRPAGQIVVRDISDRKEAEQGLRAADERFRALVEHLPAVVYIESPGGNPEHFYMSPQVKAVFGYTAEEWRWTPNFWLDRVHPDDRPFVASDDERTDRDHDAFSLDYRFLAADGTWRWIHDEAVFLDGPGGNGFWQGFMLDITDRKRVEEKLATALDVEREGAQRLRALDEMKNTFLQAVSHDLRTPLAAILGLAITLERGEVELDEGDARDLAGRIAENARKLDRLVTNLLDMDRLARGIVSPKLAPVDVGELVERIVVEADLIEPSRLTIDVEPVVVPVDASKVERIVENLLANTARHTPSNSHVWVSVQGEGGGVLLKVEDSGVGVPAEIRETLFEPFQQGPDAPQHSPGVGVGLTLVRRFAELHGGRAWIEDREGGGASFRIFLPGVHQEEEVAS